MTPYGSARSLITIGVMISVACLLFAVLTMCQQGQRYRAQIQTQNATGKALDRVTTKTETIRSDQKEKQADVDTIQGSDQRLPDGFASDLQRVRDGKRRNP